MQLLKDRCSLLGCSCSAVQDAKVLLKAAIEVVGINNCSIYLGDIGVYIIGDVHRRGIASATPFLKLLVALYEGEVGQFVK